MHIAVSYSDKALSQLGQSDYGGKLEDKGCKNMVLGALGVYLKKNKAAVLSLLFRNTRTVLKGEHSMLYFCL